MPTYYSPNEKAFLDMIAFSEGTSTVPGSDNGYNVLVGGQLFHSYADHPHIMVKLSRTLTSSAAGRYQILSHFWDVYKKQLRLLDFSPASQDDVAIRQIGECHALIDIELGRLSVAIRKCAHIWASFPGSDYGQREVPYEVLAAVYTKSGGTITTEAGGIA